MDAETVTEAGGGAERGGALRAELTAVIRPPTLPMRPGRIKEVCQDMSQAYLAGVREHLKKARVTFDRYHVKQKLSEALDEVRRAEAKQHKELLKGTRYLWLKQPKNLTVKQQDWLDQLLQEPLQIVRAC